MGNINFWLKKDKELDEVKSNSHSHSNKDTLDKLSQSSLDDWNGKQTTTGNLKDNVTTFTMSKDRINITTDEKLSLTLGKISKFLTDLKGIAFKDKINKLDLETELVTEIEDKYTKSEVDNKFSTLESSLDWKESVPTFSDITTTYPKPLDGWTVNVMDTNFTFRYDGKEWVAISANAIPKATQSVDGLLSKEDKKVLDDNKNSRHSHSNKNILDTITQNLLTNWNSGYSHISDTTKHITADERIKWNNKVDKVSGKGLSSNDFTSAEKTKLASISSNANNYIHPSSHLATIITQDSTHRFVTDTEKTNWNSGYSHISDTTKHITADERTKWNNKVDKVSGKGLSSNDFTSAEKTKLASISSNANNYVHPSSHLATIITQDSTHRFVTDTEKTNWNSGYSHISDATKHITADERIKWNNKVDKVSGKGLSSNDFTSAEKTKLASISSNANNYVHPSSHLATIITQDSTHRFVTDTEKTNWNSGYSHISDTTKHITADERTKWNNKVDKVSGKGLSSNDFTSAEKTKLANVVTNLKNGNGTGNVVMSSCSANGTNSLVIGTNNTDNIYNTMQVFNVAEISFTNIHCYASYTFDESVQVGDMLSLLGEMDMPIGAGTLVSKSVQRTELVLIIDNITWYEHCSSGMLQGISISNKLDNALITGKYNRIDESSLFIIGNGTSSTNRTNAFKVDTIGNTFAKAFLSSSADIAENFEWADGNLNNEDRVGLFVTFEGEKIKLANPDDYIAGIVSGCPSFTGNSDNGQWQGIYLKDDFDRIIYEDSTNHVEKVPKINPEYDPTRKYISRENRVEWAHIGTNGILSVYDDGTCQANGYCKPTYGGIATKSNDGYRVLKRLKPNIIRIYFK